MVGPLAGDEKRVSEWRVAHSMLPGEQMMLGLDWRNVLLIRGQWVKKVLRAALLKRNPCVALWHDGMHWSHERSEEQAVWDSQGLSALEVENKFWRWM